MNRALVCLHLDGLLGSLNLMNSNLRWQKKKTVFAHENIHHTVAALKVMPPIL